MTPLLENLFALPVPAKTIRCKIFADHLFTFSTKTGKNNDRSIRLPPGNYQFLFTTKDCTEEMAREVVEVDEFGYMFYRNYLKPDEPFDEATESLSSLLKSKNLDTANNHAIVKKV